VHAFVFDDTNVLLHYQFFDEVDWHTQLGVTSVTLVFAPVILAELDRHKWSGSRREKARAKSVLKKIASLGLLTTPVSLRPGVDAMALDAEPPDALFMQHRLHPQASDDRLLASLLGFGEERPGNRVMILSADTGLGVKARSRRIEIVAPADSLELPDEPDDVERELEKTRRELNEITGAAPDLALTFGDANTHATFQVRAVGEFDYQALGRLRDAWRKKHPHVSGMDSLQLPGGEVVSFSALQGVPGFVSAADAAAHNTAIDGYYGEYDAFLKLWPSALNRHFRVLKFSLVLENTGTVPADDVDLQLWTDASGAWLRKMPKLPFPPIVPKRRSPYDLGPIAEMPFLNHLPSNAFLHPAANEDGPNISGEGSEERVQYTIKRVIHHVPCELPIVYFQFNSDADVRSFNVNVRLVAANIRKPKTGSLQVEVTRSAPAAPPAPGRADDDDED
jgi:hypothetical protein